MRSLKSQAESIAVERSWILKRERETKSEQLPSLRCVCCSQKILHTRTITSQEKVSKFTDLNIELGYKNAVDVQKPGLQQKRILNRVWNQRFEA